MIRYSAKVQDNNINERPRTGQNRESNANFYEFDKVSSARGFEDVDSVYCTPVKAKRMPSAKPRKSITNQSLRKSQFKNDENFYMREQKETADIGQYIAEVDSDLHVAKSDRTLTSIVRQSEITAQESESQINDDQIMLVSLKTTKNATQKKKNTEARVTQQAPSLVQARDDVKTRRVYINEDANETKVILNDSTFSSGVN